MSSPLAFLSAFLLSSFSCFSLAYRERNSRRRGDFRKQISITGCLKSKDTFVCCIRLLDPVVRVHGGDKGLSGLRQTKVNVCTEKTQHSWQRDNTQYVYSTEIWDYSWNSKLLGLFLQYLHFLFVNTNICIC